LTYSQDLYKMEKSRNFWRKAALIGVPAAAGACFLAGMLLGRQRPI
jgi:hypothetical protein